MLLTVLALVSGCASVPAPPPVNPFVGTWTLTIDWWGSGGGADHALIVSLDLTGTLEFQDGNTANVADVKVEGGALAFALVFTKAGQEMKMPFQGTISGDTIKGAFEGGKIPADGVRVKPESE